MNGEWKLIGIGFAIALAGAAAAMLLIVGVSAGYVGKMTVSVASLALSLCLAITFRVSLGPFLDALDLREAKFAKDKDIAAAQLDETHPPVI